MNTEGIHFSQVEWGKIRSTLRREPNPLETMLLAGMWSEHCSYKSTKHLLRQLPKHSERVVASIGAHAGVIDLADGIAVAFKIESHNHPSMVEPFSGAATGVGGILRDLIAAGARPCAILDGLCFGDVQHTQVAKTMRGVVAGISAYGNAIGVANVGGSLSFDASYTHNPLVNILAAGLVATPRVRGAASPRPLGTLVLVGAPTGADGVMGAAFASTELQAGSVKNAIQIADPFAGKLLMEAMLTLADNQMLACQDLGACGLLCASSEMAAASGAGVCVRLEKVPLRQNGLLPTQILLSETQERFLLSVKPDHVEDVVAHFHRFSLSACPCGELNQSAAYRVYWGEQLLADLPIDLLVGGAPPPNWPLADLPAAAPVASAYRPTRANEHLWTTVTTLLTSLRLSDIEAVVTQYDQSVGNVTVWGPQQAASAVLRLPGRQQGFALSLTGRGSRHPYAAAQAAMAEAMRNLACVGAKLLAVVDGLNFASPENPLVMRAIEQSIQGLQVAATTLAVPVVGGNVSLYNQFAGNDGILPTCMVGALGDIKDVTFSPGYGCQSGEQVVLILPRLPPAVHGASTGLPQTATLPPLVNLGQEMQLQHSLLTLYRHLPGSVSAACAVGRGGVLLQLIKLCMYNHLGGRFDMCAAFGEHCTDWDCLGECPARALLVVAPEQLAAVMHCFASNTDTAMVAHHLGGLQPNQEGLHIQPLGNIAYEVMATAYGQRLRAP